MSRRCGWRTPVNLDQGAAARNCLGGIRQGIPADRTPTHPEHHGFFAKVKEFLGEPPLARSDFGPPGGFCPSCLAFLSEGLGQGALVRELAEIARGHDPIFLALLHHSTLTSCRDRAEYVFGGRHAVVAWQCPTREMAAGAGCPRSRRAVWSVEAREPVARRLKRPLTPQVAKTCIAALAERRAPILVHTARLPRVRAGRWVSISSSESGRPDHAFGGVGSSAKIRIRGPNVDRRSSTADRCAASLPRA